MKIALITPRYGAEITHGPEHACRLLAEQLAERHDVDVLTTCVRDAISWKNGYPEGADRVRGVLVRRFSATGGRDPHGFDALSRRMFTTAHSRADELEWVRRSGTCSSGLIDFLRRQHRNYDVFAFFSYAAGTTVHGITIAPDRSIIFPFAEIHPALRLLLYQDTISAAAAVGYASAAERKVVHAYLHRRPRAEEVVGIGVGAVYESHYPRLSESTLEDEVEDEEAAGEAREQDSAPLHLSGRGVLFRRRHRLYDRFALYAGGVDGDNGTEELIEYFHTYAGNDTEAQPSDGTVSLVLLGVKMMRLPAEPWLRSAGVLPDRDRLAALAAADVALAPDPHDTVAEQTLDAMAAGTPVLASACSAAAVDHVRRANAGLMYANRDEFVEAMRLLMSNERLRLALGRNGRRYVQQHYRWDAVVGRFERLVSKVKSQKS